MAGSVAFPAATIPTSWGSGAPGAATAPHSSNIALLSIGAQVEKSRGSENFSGYGVCVCVAFLEG